MTHLTRKEKLKFVVARCLYPRIFALGFAEGEGSFGMTYNNNPNSLRSTAYDLGRDAKRKGLNLDEEV